MNTRTKYFRDCLFFVLRHTARRPFVQYTEQARSYKVLVARPSVNHTNWADEALKNNNRIHITRLIEGILKCRST